MDPHRFDTLLRSLSATPSRRGALRLLAGSACGGLLTLGALSSDAKKGGKGKRKKGKKGKVTICHNGQTITVSKSALKAHLGHGDSVGTCLTPDPPPPPPPIFQFAAVDMTGAKEVPGPGDPEGAGSAQFTIQGSTICGTFQFTTSTPNSAVNGTHIHVGDSTEFGVIVVNFSQAVLNQQTCVPCPGTTCDQIKSTPAEFYANIHTVAFPDGAVRAQLQAV